MRGASPLAPQPSPHAFVCCAIRLSVSSLITRPPPQQMLLLSLHPLEPSSVATRPIQLLRSLVPSEGHKLIYENFSVAG